MVTGLWTMHQHAFVVHFKPQTWSLLVRFIRKPLSKFMSSGDWQGYQVPVKAAVMLTALQLTQLLLLLIGRCRVPARVTPFIRVTHPEEIVNFLKQSCRCLH